MNKFKLLITIKCKFKDVDKLQKILIQKYNAIWPSMQNELNPHKLLNFKKECPYMKDDNVILLHIYYYDTIMLSENVKNKKRIKYTTDKSLFNNYKKIINAKQIFRKEKLKRIIK